MKRTMLITAALFIFQLASGRTSLAEDQNRDMVYSTYGTIVKGIEAAFDPSYITFTGGLNWSDSIDNDDLLYEARIAVHFPWINNCKKDSPRCTRDDVFRLYAPIRLQVRQYTSDSSPVSTPSYNPGLRLYYWNTSWVNVGKELHSVHYLSLGVHHYSNGQSGEHYTGGAINTKDGSFSLDYVELAYYYETIDKEGGPDDWWKVNVRKYLTGWTWESPQHDYYEKWLFEASRKKRLNRYGITTQLTAGYKHDRTYVSPGDNASFRDNMQYTAEAFIPVKCPKVRFFHWDNMSVYLRWDKGYDYYNINYQNRINRLQAGLVTGVF